MAEKRYESGFMKYLFCVALLLAAGMAQAAQVVATIKPLHSLVAAVMEGDGEPVLLVAGAASPHEFQMIPSQRQALEHADVVFAIGAGMEPYLPQDAPVVRMAEQTGIFVLPAREGDFTEGAEHSGPPDPHLWMDPTNAITMVDVIAAKLGELYPAHADLYRENAARLKGRIEETDAAIHARMGGAKGGIIVFHDALQYFERAYGVRAVGSITATHEVLPGAKHLSALRAMLSGGEAGCVLSEPQYQGKLVGQLVEGTGARVGVMDPEGLSFKAGPEMYVDLLAATADEIEACVR